ncbi:MAG: DUF3817 domain-containing protein [Bacteroidetes bacterium]|nr:DUF3817 domain-containing protein [Bacteroidota bacterium]
MNKYLTSAIGRFRLIAFLEGISLILLVFVGMPLKYMADNPLWVEVIGPIHGGLFLLFIYFTLRTAMDQEWKFFKTTWLVLLSSFIPFGTFYVDHKILKPIHE